MSGEQMLKLGCPWEREGACVSVCSHCAKVFPVAISALIPTFPSLSPSQALAFGAHGHFHRGRANPTTTRVTPHILMSTSKSPPKLFDLWSYLLPGGSVLFWSVQGPPAAGAFFLFVLTPLLPQLNTHSHLCQEELCHTLSYPVSAGLFLQGGWDPAPLPGHCK